MYFDVGGYIYTLSDRIYSSIIYVEFYVKGSTFCCSHKEGIQL